MAIGNRLLETASRKHRQGSLFLGRRLVQSGAAALGRSRFVLRAQFFELPRPGFKKSN